jgi:hypothetical protein
MNRFMKCVKFESNNIWRFYEIKCWTWTTFMTPEIDWGIQIARGDSPLEKKIGHKTSWYKICLEEN